MIQVLLVSPRCGASDSGARAPDETDALDAGFPELWTNFHRNRPTDRARDGGARQTRARAAARREEIAARRAQLQALQAQRRRARRAVRRPRAASASPTDSSGSETASSALHDAVQTNHLYLAGLAGLLDAHQIAQRCAFLHEPLYLPRDAAARRATLLRCLPRKIAAARAFAEQRTRERALDLSRAFSSLQQFPDAASGDLVLVHLEVTPFPEIRRVRKVLAAVRYWANHLEICLSGQLGSLTLRDDALDDDAAPGCSLRRLVSALDGGRELEAHAAVFRALLHDREALLTIQGVDRDELYPLRRLDRVRAQITGVMRIVQLDGERGVSLARFAVVRLHAGAGAASEELQGVLAQSAGRWIQVVKNVIHERVYAADGDDDEDGDEV